MTWGIIFVIESSEKLLHALLITEISELFRNLYEIGVDKD
jgi:hypothetical protein